LVVLFQIAAILYRAENHLPDVFSKLTDLESSTRILSFLYNPPIQW